MLRAMNPLTSFAILIATAQSLASMVNVRDQLHLRPATACKAVAARLRSGLIVLRAFLRRLVILIALDMEWTLVDTRGPMKRPHKRKAKSRAVLTLGGLDVQGASPWLNAVGPNFKARVKTGNNGPVEVNMAKLYAQLEYLAKIASDPTAKAKRLAFHFARTYEGLMMAPQGPKRIAGRWGTEVRACYDAIAAAIMTKSRNRPPPLPPPRTYYPTIIAL
jgi:hypothetical protein